MYSKYSKDCNQNSYNPSLETVCDDARESSYGMTDTCCCKCNHSYDNSNCSCGFDEEINLFPSNPMLAQSYVPIQYMDKTFTPCCGLKMGTIFPELVSPYYPGQSMREIDYLRERNEIGEGCNG